MRDETGHLIQDLGARKLGRDPNEHARTLPTLHKRCQCSCNRASSPASSPTASLPPGTRVGTAAPDPRDSCARGQEIGKKNNRNKRLGPGADAMETSLPEECGCGVRGRVQLGGTCYHNRGLGKIGTRRVVSLTAMQKCVCTTLSCLQAAGMYACHGRPRLHARTVLRTTNLELEPRWR